MCSSGMKSNPRPVEFWGRVYLATALLLCAPSYLAWFRPGFNLGESEFDAWLGLIPSKLPGQLWHVMGFVSLGVCFLKLARSKDEIPLRYVAVAWALFFAALPWMSPDVSFYLAKGWIEVRYGLSPYTTTIAQIPGNVADPILTDVVASIRDVPGNYGAVFQKLSALIATIANGRPLVGVLLFKFVSALALYGCWRLVDHISTLVPGSAPLGLRWIALNPLLLFNFVTAAHNDVLLMVLVLSAVWAALEGRWIIAGLALGFGVALKLAPLFILPAFGAFALRTFDVRRGVSGVVMLGGGLVFGVGTSLAIDPRSANFLLTVASNALGGARTSVHMILIPWFTRWEYPFGMDSLLLGKVLFVVIGAILLRQNFLDSKQPREAAFVVSCFELFVLAQFLVMPNMAEWYLLWPLCLAVLYGRTQTLQWCGRLSTLYMPIAIWHVVGLASVVVLSQSVLLGILSMAHFGYVARKNGWLPSI